METGSALVSLFADIVADPGLLLAWRAPLAALLAASSSSSSSSAAGEDATGARSLPPLPSELTAHAAFERHLALTLLVFALISAVMTVMLLRAQRPEAAKRDEQRARKALMFAKGAAREKLQKELAESARTYDPFRFRHAIAVLIGAAIAQASFGMMRTSFHSTRHLMYTLQPDRIETHSQNCCHVSLFIL